MSTSAYPKILHIGDKPIADLFDGEVEITEKLDGSQIGFGWVQGEFVIRSKGQEINLEAPDKMFKSAIEYLLSVMSKVPKGYFFYGEYLEKPRHSTLAYDRIPKNHISLFGVLADDKTLLGYSGIEEYAQVLDIDPIPLLYSGKSDVDHVMTLLETVSYLGGQHIEGVVVKRYEPWMFLNQFLCPVKAGKYVTERFKETHIRDWKRDHTAKGSLDKLKESVKTEARWNKAIQHLKERGEFEGTVRDIGKLIKEIQTDLDQEESLNIKDALYKIYSPEILKYSTNGFVDWYKERIMRGEFQ